MTSSWESLGAGICLREEFAKLREDQVTQWRETSLPNGRMAEARLRLCCMCMHLCVHVCALCVGVCMYVCLHCGCVSVCACTRSQSL